MGKQFAVGIFNILRCEGGACFSQVFSVCDLQQTYFELAAYVFQYLAVRFYFMARFMAGNNHIAQHIFFS